MRIALFLVLALVAVPRHGSAAPIVEMEFLNSDLAFGASADQFGWDLSAFWAKGFDDSSWDVWNTGYQASSGPLDHQTDLIDGSGNVVGTEYVYLGGTFEIFFVMENNGDVRTGSFLASIDRLTVRSGVHEGDQVELLYQLGRGLFDDSIADTLGLSGRTAGGYAYAQLLLTGEEDGPGVQVNTIHQASDGVNDIVIEAPEPAALALLALGVAGLWRRRSTRR
jgi:MYXO-CTERM domain-containing protein